MKPRIYIATETDAEQVAIALVQRGYAIYAPQLLGSIYHKSQEIGFPVWLAHHREWLLFCHALLCLKEVGIEPALAWAQEFNIPIFYSLDTLIACIRIDANAVVANFPTATPARAVASPGSVASAVTTAGTTAPTRSRGGRVSVPGRAGGVPMVVPNVLYDGEEFSCPGCDRRFMTEASIFDHVLSYHYPMLRGENPIT